MNGIDSVLKNNDIVNHKFVVSNFGENTIDDASITKKDGDLAVKESRYQVWLIRILSSHGCSWLLLEVWLRTVRRFCSEFVNDFELI